MVSKNREIVCSEPAKTGRCEGPCPQPPHIFFKMEVTFDLNKILQFCFDIMKDKKNIFNNISFKLGTYNPYVKRNLLTKAFFTMTSSKYLTRQKRKDFWHFWRATGFNFCIHKIFIKDISFSEYRNRIEISTLDQKQQPF